MHGAAVAETAEAKSAVHAFTAQRNNACGTLPGSITAGSPNRPTMSAPPPAGVVRTHFAAADQHSWGDQTITGDAVIVLTAVMDSAGTSAANSLTAAAVADLKAHPAH